MKASEFKRKMEKHLTLIDVAEAKAEGWEKLARDLADAHGVDRDTWDAMLKEYGL